jgi:two-component system, cell cycle sensor histidine kinase and response regulator CckA
VAEPQSGPSRPVIVLLAEDEEPLRTMVARVLWAEGYRTLEARDGAEALHLARLSLPHLDLVITDVVMPTMDGRELGRELAKHSPDLPVLYISGYVRGDVFHRDGPGAPSHFLQKPFSNDDLLEAVKALLAASPRRSTGTLAN